MLAFTSRSGAESPPSLTIGEWRVDPTVNQLTREAESVRIEPKAMDVLIALARQPGQVVSRETLLAAVWPGVVVTDEVLTQCIIKLRRALRDDPRAPSYIETISKRGYRLITPVQQNGGARGASVTEKSKGLSRPPCRRMAYLGAAAVLAIAMTAAALYVFHPERRPGAVTDAYANAVQMGHGSRSAAMTVSVLPFEWLGVDAKQSYLARGISNDLMTGLSRLSGLRVITLSTPSPADAESARYLISGTVQRQDSALRINIRLIDASTKEQIWSERFERPYSDLFAIQDEIVFKVTEQLPARMTEAERQRLAKRYTRSLEAYDHFLRGQALSLVRRVEENDEAREHYRRALDLDPEFARAYASLAMTYAMDYRLHPSADGSPALDKARHFAEAARLIDPNIPEIHWALGFVKVQSRRHHDALKDLQTAIALDRSFADAYALMGGIYTYIGQPAKSVPLLRAALRLNPDGGYLYYLLLGRAYLFQNEIDQALINLREALARNPVNFETRVYAAAAMIAAGKRSDAEWELEEIRALEARFSIRQWLATYPMTDVPQQQRLIELLQTLGV